MALIPDFRPWRGLATALSARQSARPVPATAAAVPGQIDDNADWVWQPGAFRSALSPRGHVGFAPGLSIGDGLRLFHDCPLRETSVRQRPSGPEAGQDAGPHGLLIETLHFRGSYLSLVVSVPQDVARQLARHHIVTLGARVMLSTPTEVFVRLNLRHGPNLSSVTRQAPMGQQDLRVDFDLDAVDFDPRRITGAWIDLILGRPEMTRCEIDSLTLSRRLRAAL